MEKLPTPENVGDKEKRLAGLLKERGVEDPEARSLLDSWTRGQESEVKESSDPATAAIELNLRKARLYFAAGHGEEAFESFEAAQMQARNENRDELYQTIIAEMDRLESEQG